MPLISCASGAQTGSCTSTCAPIVQARNRSPRKQHWPDCWTAIGIDPQYLPEGLEHRAALWRDRMAGQRAVLVLDNAASSAQVAPLLPGGGSCLVLVTTRRHLGDLPGIGAGVLLEVLPPDQAQEMFVRLAPRATADPSEAVAELVATAGFLSLAISLLARVYARHPSWLLADLIAETRGSLLTLAAETDSMGAAFDVSYRYLTAAQQQFFHRIGQRLGAVRSTATLRPPWPTLACARPQST